MKTLEQIEPRTPISTLPYKITAPGSYYLARNLTGEPDEDGITIDADNVTVDLGGFELVGTSGFTPGILVLAAGEKGGRVNITIRNGTVRNWAGGGVIAGSFECVGMKVEDLRALDNGGAGVRLGNTGTAERCEARGNGEGISGGFACQVLSCSANAQKGGGSGIDLNSGAIVRDCVASENAGDGISAGHDSVIANSSAYRNQRRGFDIGEGSSLSHCSAGDNSNEGLATGTAAVLEHCTAYNNSGDGIRVGEGSVVDHCAAVFNRGNAGIFADAGVVITACTVRGNTSSSSPSAGITTGNNSRVSQCVITDTLTTAASATVLTGMGINSGAGSTLERNTVQRSKGNGIRIGSQGVVVGNSCDNSGFGTFDGAGIHVIGTQSRIEGNNVSNSDRGIHVIGADNLIIKNSATANTTNYEIVAGNKVGVIQVAGTSGAISGSSGGGFVGTNEPWANFSF